jgi:hypothetical protein
VIKKIYSLFAKLPDSRVKGRCEYSLPQLGILFFIGILAGCKTWKATHLYLSLPDTVKWLRSHMPDLKRIPGVDTLARNIAKLDPSHLTSILVKLAPDFLRRGRLTRKRGRPRNDELPQGIAIDGKTLRGAAPKKTHLVNALLDFVLLLQIKILEKSNEITIIPAVLEAIAKADLLTGRLVTMDAMGCQKSIVTMIRHYRAHYIICLKGNQTGLLEQVKQIFDLGLDKYPGDFVVRKYSSPPEKGHGRSESWVSTVVYITTAEATAWIDKAVD